MFRTVVDKEKKDHMLVLKFKEALKYHKIEHVTLVYMGDYYGESIPDGDRKNRWVIENEGFRHLHGTYRLKMSRDW